MNVNLHIRYKTAIIKNYIGHKLLQKNIKPYVVL